MDDVSVGTKSGSIADDRSVFSRDDRSAISREVARESGPLLSSREATAFISPARKCGVGISREN